MCYDNISIVKTVSTFIAVEDDASIGSFVSRSSRTSFKETQKNRNFDKDKSRIFYVNELKKTIQMLTDTTDEVVIIQESHYHLPEDFLENKNFIEDITHSSRTQGTTVEHNINQNYATNMLESGKATESPLASG